MTTGKNHIGFTTSAKGAKTFRTFNPESNTENDTLFYEASEQEIETAVRLAAKAFTTYRTTSGPERATFLRTIADEMEALGDTLFTMYCTESGLPKGRAQGECGRTLGQLRMFADLVETDNWRKPTISGDQKELRQALIPLGPVVVFGASNFPLAYSTAGGDTASALAAGCPVIVKSHPMHAGTGELVAQCIVKAAQKTGMPEGVFSNLNSSGIEVGQQLVKHPEVKAVGFTGSIKGGRALYDLAAQREEPIPVFAEMGSINPVIISKGAAKARAKELAETYAGSITLGTGQFCTNPGLILGIANDDLATFTQQLGEKTAAIAPATMLHPNIKKGYIKNGDEVINQSDTTVVAAYDGDLDANYAQAKIVTVSGDAFLKNKKLHQEVFGPFSMVVQCKDEEQRIEIINQLEGQLTGTVIAQEDEYSSLSPLIESLQNRVGRIILNGVPTGVAVADAMTHGGPYPASTDSRFTAVGNHSILRWARPFSYQDFPESMLPAYLK